jgi:hypothetical protein
VADARVHRQELSLDGVLGAGRAPRAGADFALALRRAG